MDWGQFEPAIRRWEAVLGRPVPAPTVWSAAYRKARQLRMECRHPKPVGMRGSLRPAWVLNPRFVEWLMGLPAGWVTDVPDLSRSQQLRLLGNGVVPQQGEAALLRLLLGIGRRRKRKAGAA
ncbi:DNA (cytosine-5)-methyltransferase 1 [Lentzea xinjiangensis]|uniref:DNA (Cytosine-5)-methyltransferase 1 n=1 Tax=Lentzea xinjiangensis TaxID=402600 RepID=A0A1H9TEI6_9PSEU|nr:DNA (cytosine-5)-methyltransferase 1 [Lentzea xinjiangensis]